MPRVKPFEIEQNRRRSWAVVEKWRCLNDYTFADVARLWGCAVSTVSYRKKNPETLTLGEIRKMKLSDAELLELVR